jgi:predicted transcriptional regulator
MTKKKISHAHLSRRERQIMDILFAAGEASAADVRKALPDPPSYSAVRALLGILEEKGHVNHRRQGRAYVYSPTVSQTKAARSALKHVVRTFFDDSVEQTVATLLSMSSAKVPQEEIDRLTELLESRKKKGGN